MEEKADIFCGIAEIKSHLFCKINCKLHFRYEILGDSGKSVRIRPIIKKILIFKIVKFYKFKSVFFSLI